MEGKDVLFPQDASIYTQRGKLGLTIGITTQGKMMPYIDGYNREMLMIFNTWEATLIPKH